MTPWGNFSDLLDVLEFVAREHGPRTALRFPTSGDGATLTFEQLLTKSLNVAAALTIQRVKKGDRVGLLFENSPEFVQTFFGCIAAGLVPIALKPPRLPAQEKPLLAALESFGTALIVTANPLQAPGKTSARVLTWAELESSLSPGASRREKSARDQLAYIQCTSGSTSLPKGCCISHGGLILQFKILGEVLGLGPSTSGVNWLPYYHDMGLVMYFLTFLAYGVPSTHYRPADFAADPLRWLGWVTETGATTAGIPGFAMSLIARSLKGSESAASRFDCSRLRHLMVGAEQIHERALREFIEAVRPCRLAPEAIHFGYGMSEATLGISRAKASDRPFLTRIDDKALPFPVANLGPPVENLRIWAERPDGAPCAEGEAGELVFDAPFAMLGYWPLPAKHKREPVRTGDYGFLHQGDIYIMGRVKEVLILAGENYSPQVFEDIALESGAGDSLAIGVASEARGTEALYMVSTDSPAAREASERAAQAIFERTQVAVHEWVFVPKGWIPRTSNGKKMRLAAGKKLEGMLEERRNR
jgi:acyl-CoA synthetase (AMP-forming)/AMP-acid ligase II